MRDTPQNTKGDKGSASPFEQFQQTVDSLIQSVKDAEFQKMLAARNEEYMAAEPGDSDDELTQEDIEGTEQLKAQIRFQEICNDVRGRCKKVIEAKRTDSNSSAYREAVHCLTLVQKMEAGDASVLQEFSDASHILLQALQAEDETRSRRASSQGSAGVKTPSMRWDVFISHASEDKEAFVRPLAIALQKKNVRTWFDEFTLTVGDSLRSSIDVGLASSRYGIVVISPSFLAKDWPQKELDGLFAREVDGRKVILPVWHKVDEKTLRERSPLLADRVATSSAKGVDGVVLDLMKAMQ